MAETAYNFEYFMPMEKQQRPEKKLKVVGPTAAKREKSARTLQIHKTLKIIFTALAIVVLICGVLYTQTNVAELQSDIDARRRELNDAQSYNTYLTFELEGMSNIRGIEQRAQELGLVRTNNNQITYVRVDEDSGIEVKENIFSALFEKTRTGLLNIADYISP